MGATMDELYFDRLPLDLFRSGRSSGPQLNKPRTMPPRQPGESFDIEVYDKNGGAWVHHESGGISLFNKPIPRWGDRWWKLPKASPIPAGLRVSRDKRVNPVTGEIHYTIRPAYDMPLALFVQLLTAFSTLAVPDFAISQRKA
jgi:hypothetical protein